MAAGSSQGRALAPFISAVQAQGAALCCSQPPEKLGLRPSSCGEYLLCTNGLWALGAGEKVAAVPAPGHTLSARPLSPRTCS